MVPKKQASGRVYLVGAGPGDPGLITARGLELLQRADVVVYDALANPALLEQAPVEAKKIYVGKRAREHALPQDQINQLLVDHSVQGRVIIRLKGGDPYLFGRGAEEVAYLTRHGVACEMVPGVTAGIAAPAAAGVPVTHRHMASTVTFVTGHEDPNKTESSVDYQALAGLILAGGTVCFYMGVGRLKAIVDQFLGFGLTDRMPVAVVQWGTMPQQRSIRSNLANVVIEVAEAGLGAPAIIVVGEVAGMNEPGLDYFTRRPLFGQRIVITRTRQQSSDLRCCLEDQGASVLEAPTIDLIAPVDWSSVDKAIRDIGRYDWLVLTSANGATALEERLAGMGLDARHLAGVKMAAIGDATAKAMQQCLGVRVDLVPPRYVAESLAQAMIDTETVNGKRLLLLRADIARPALPKLLEDAGAQITELTIYQTRRVDALPEKVFAALRDGEVDWVTFTSSSTINNMVELLGEERALLENVKIASIGPITSQTIRDRGLEPTVEASTSNIQGLVDVMVGASV